MFATGEEAITEDQEEVPIEENKGWPIGTYVLALGGGFLIFAGIVGCVLGA